VLHNLWISSCSWRVRFALAFKRIPYTYKRVSLGAPQPQHATAAAAAAATTANQHSAAYRTRLNPMREIPALESDGPTMAQSYAILEYLEETRAPQFPLLPAAPLLRARARQIALASVSNMQPLQNMRVLRHLQQHYTANDEAAAADANSWPRHFITLGLQGLEQILEQSAGTYCVGDDVTIADACILPQLYNALRFDASLDAFPVCRRVMQALREHPATLASHPTAQPDTPAGTPDLFADLDK
jgi:maleylacetoacetate isomerase